MTTCDHCGNEFVKTQHTQRYCSARCNKRSREALRRKRLREEFKHNKEREAWKLNVVGRCNNPYKVLYRTIDEAICYIIATKSWNMSPYPCTCGFYHIGHDGKANKTKALEGYYKSKSYLKKQQYKLDIRQKELHNV